LPEETDWLSTKKQCPVQKQKRCIAFDVFINLQIAQQKLTNHFINFLPSLTAFTGLHTITAELTFHRVAKYNLVSELIDFLS
jgi:hypothetical protein